MKTRGLFSKPPPEGRGTQLRFLCTCGRRPIELKDLRCCRLCYYRQYDSLRWFGGLRDLILKRDRFACRACGAARRLVVHHRDERNAQPLLITLCIRCHVRLHHSRRFRQWVPKLCSNYGASCIRVARCSCNCPLQRKKTRLLV